jgi:uncharacterized membrane protein YfcA
MDVLALFVLVCLGSLVAGFVGSLTGLGGGVILVPLLTIGFGVDIRYAIGASLIAVIATSSGAAIAYVREGFSNIRVGMMLEVATTLGATGGAMLVSHVPTGLLSIVFGLVLFATLLPAGRPGHHREPNGEADRLASRLRMDGTYPSLTGTRAYHVRGVPLGFGLMAVAGVLSGLLGIGSGAMKVLAMDRAMRIPFKVSTTTSNFMIGVTAAASAGVYLNKGYVDPGLAAPTMLGVLAGSLIGARILPGTATRVLRIVFSLVIVALAIEMIYHGVTGKL